MFKQIKTAEQIAEDKAKQEAEQRIAKLKQLLLDSDYKVLPDYDKTDETIIADRQAWRDKIRELEKTLPVEED